MKVAEVAHSVCNTCPNTCTVLSFVPRAGGWMSATAALKKCYRRYCQNWSGPST